MHLTKVKICGITNAEDALAAVNLGADMLGFIFYPKSPRCIQPQKATEIISTIPTFVDTVGVFVNPTAQQIQEADEEGWLNWIQLHGDETPEFCAGLGWMNARVIKAVRVRDKSDIDNALRFRTDALLLDTYVEGQYGGTGKTFDWSLLDHIPNRFFLSGGINPDNVAAAVEIGPYGVDISSGIEAEPGKKDHNKMKELFENISRVTGRKVRA